MKPLSLTLENIGPFTHTTRIDFTALGEMFLICGDTGSGKTTILDAMCYALYGKLAGTHTPNPRTLKSDFARDEDTASITFEFSVKGGCYKVTRMPPRLYTNRNGKAAEKPCEVCLYQKDESGAYTVLSGKTSEVDAALEELIGLSVEEFSRIVLLPQGDFAEFLHLSSNDRKAALSKLFPVSEYQNITAYVEKIASAHKAELASIEQNILALAETFDPKQAEQELSSIKETQERLYAEQQTAQETLMECAAREAKAKRLYNDIAEYEAAKEETQTLLQKEPYMQSVNEKTARGKRARTVEPFYKKHDDVTKNSLSLARQKEETAQKLKEAQNKEALLTEQKPHITALQKEIASLEEAISSLDKATAIEESLNQTKTALGTLTESQETLEASIKQKEALMLPLTQSINENAHFANELTLLSKQDDDATEALTHAKEVSRLANEYHSIKEKCAQTKTALNESAESLKNLTNAVTIARATLDDLENEQKQAEQNDMALALSKTLVPDAPCPVCGSTHHPSPAQKSEHDAVALLTLTEKLSAARVLYEKAKAEQQKGETLTAGLTARLTEFTLQLKNAESALHELGGIVSPLDAKTALEAAYAKKEATKNALTEAQCATNKRTEDEKQKQAIENELNPLRAQKEALTKDVVQKQTELTQLLRQYKDLTHGKLNENESATALIDSYTKTVARYRDEIARHDASVKENIRSSSALQGSLELLAETLEKAKAEVTEAETLFTQSLRKNGFDSVEAFLASLIEESALKANEESFNAWNLAVKAAEAREESLCQKLTTTQKPNMELIAAESAQTKAHIEQLNKELTELSGKKELLYDRQKQWTALEQKRAALTKESSRYAKLSDDLSGKNAKGLSFESWILGVYLEEITIHASRRLERISDGRYKLLLKSEKSSGKQKYSGLDLEVFDAFTGKKRACETLSGGETFLVSISLALALTDVVQSKSGGIQLDSLFIDEGFGTLDGTTLENALSILDEIRESRTIGLISHVGELKNRIESRIEVRKTPTGSTVEIKR